MHEFTALRPIYAPGTGVAGYQRGFEVSAGVVEAWGLVVGDDVVEGDLPDGDVPAPAATRPGPEANRAAWESWAVANEWKPEDAAAASQDDLEAVAVEQSDDRPADSAKKDVWVDYAVDRGLDRETAEGKTKAELQAWEPTAGDPVALAATEANQA